MSIMPHPDSKLSPRNDGQRDTSLAVNLGRLLPGSSLRSLRVDYSGNSLGALRARTTLTLDDQTLERAIATAQPVVLLFENSDPALPIVTGLVQTAEPHLALVADAAPDVPPDVDEPTEARVDGRRVVLEGKEEVVLKCGKASITLKADGRLVLRGAYVETYSKGVNRIKGGVVKIN